MSPWSISAAKPGDPSATAVVVVSGLGAAGAVFESMPGCDRAPFGPGIVPCVHLPLVSFAPNRRVGGRAWGFVNGAGGRAQSDRAACRRPWPRCGPAHRRHRLCSEPSPRQRLVWYISRQRKGGVGEREGKGRYGGVIFFLLFLAFPWTPLLACSPNSMLPCDSRCRPPSCDRRNGCGGGEPACLPSAPRWEHSPPRVVVGDR